MRKESIFLTVLIVVIFLNFFLVGCNSIPNDPMPNDFNENPVGIASERLFWQGTLATPPASPSINWAYYNSTDKKSYIWDGIAWQVLAQDGAATSMSFSGGDGSLSNPFLVATPEQLHLVRNHLDKHFLQIANIDVDHAILSGKPWYDSVHGWLPIGPEEISSSGFAGSYDGNNNEIRNLMMNRADSREIYGVFSKTELGANLQNIKLSNINFSFAGASTGYGGGLVAQNNGNIKNCSVAGEVTGRTVGGLVGENNGFVIDCFTSGVIGSIANWSGGLIFINNGTVSNSYSTAAVLGSIQSGGLVVFNYGTIRSCHASGAVTSQNLYAGGLISQNVGGTVDDCFSTGAVSSVNGFMAAGLIVLNSGPVNRCYSIGNVTGNSLIGAGGFIASNNGVVNDSYSTGDVTNTNGNGAGFVGANSGSINRCFSVGAVATANCGFIKTNSGTANDSYWDTTTSGQAASAAGTGKTTVEMKQQVEFLGWNFATIWQINETTTYPYLIDNEQSPAPQ